MVRTHLDVASGWPVRPEAADAHAHALAVAWADPAGRHAEARAAQDLLQRANETVAHHLVARPDDVVWTGSGTEAVTLAVWGTARAAVLRGDPRRHLVVSAVEHSSVLATAARLAEIDGFEVTTVPVDRAGRVDADQMIAALRPDTLAVHLQHANHEVGTMQPTHEVSLACRERDVLLHVDACQTVGQVGVTLPQVGADLVSASGAKFGGVRGVGLLVMGERARLAPMVEGDDRQRGRRSGAVDVPGIAATAVALHVATSRMDAERSHREALRRRLRDGLVAVVDDVVVHGPLAETHPGIVAASALYVEGAALADALDERGFAVHTGSACSTRSGEPSHVLVAMEALTHGHVRFSVGGDTPPEAVDDAIEAYGATVRALRDQIGAPS